MFVLIDIDMIFPGDPVQSHVADIMPGPFITVCGVAKAYDDLHLIFSLRIQKMIHHPGSGPVVKKVIVKVGESAHLVKIPCLFADVTDQFFHRMGDRSRSGLLKVKIESPVLPDIPVLIKSIQENRAVQQGILHRYGGVIRDEDICHTQKLPDIEISRHIDDIIRYMSPVNLRVQTNHETVILPQFIPESLKVKMIQEMIIPLRIIPESRGIEDPFLSPHLRVLPAQFLFPSLHLMVRKIIICLGAGQCLYFLPGHTECLGVVVPDFLRTGKDAGHLPVYIPDQFQHPGIRLRRAGKFLVRTHPMP